MKISNLSVTYVESNPTGDKYFPPEPVLNVSYTITSDAPVRTYCKVWFKNWTTPYVTEYSNNLNVVFKVPLPIILYNQLKATVCVTIVVETLETESTLKQVYELTEKVSYPKYSIVTYTNLTNLHTGYLKAFCSFNNPNVKTYCTWEKSTDGIRFEPVFLQNLSPTYYKTIPSVIELPEENIDDESSNVHVAKPAYLLEGTSENDDISSRADILQLPSDVQPGDTFSFKVFTLKTLKSSENLPLPDESLVQCDYAEEFILGSAQYTVVSAPKTEIAYSDFPNSSEGKLFYNSNVAFSYGTLKHKNNILASDVGAITTPVSRVIMLPATNDSVITTLTSWRDYLIAANASEIFLISKNSGNFYAKTVSTFIGIPYADARCVKPTTNGIIFKSASKICLLYPNMYSENESVLNLTDISASVKDLIIEYPDDAEYTPFAFSTEDAYYLMMPYLKDVYRTRCLKYDYLTKVWTRYEYPMLITSVNFKSVSDIHLYGKADAGFIEVLFNSDDYSESNYGDRLSEDTVLPIAFSVDSGQKSDTLNRPKQFVESKFNLATLHGKDCFPMRVTVHVDGTPHVTVKDINTDSAFWKTSIQDVGTLNTNFVSDSSDIFNVFRQMFIRYSGKGKSIRHIIEGESVSPFKIYSINYRYKNLNIKQ